MTKTRLEMHLSEKMLGTVYILTYIVNQIFRLESTKEHVNDLETFALKWGYQLPELQPV
jgi:hypothetical protein